MPRKIFAQDSMVQGVSQQPKAVRGFSLAERQENYIPHPVKGLTKRPPCVYQGKLFDKTYSFKAHKYDRSEEERFIFTMGTQNLQAFGTDGTEYPVEDISGDIPVTAQEGLGYLDFRKTTRNAAGAVVPVNDMMPLLAEWSSMGITTMTTAISTTDKGPLGFGHWTDHELLGAAGNIFPTLSSTFSHTGDDGIHSDSDELQSIYVKLDASSPDSVALGWFDTAAWQEAVFAWDGSALTQGALGTGITAGFESLGDGVYRLWAALDVSATILTAGVDPVTLRVAAVGMATDDFQTWGYTRQISDTTLRDYLEDPNDARLLTVADTTIVLNPYASLEKADGTSETLPQIFGKHDFISGTFQDIEDVLYVQIIEGVWESDYRISVGCDSADPIEVTVSTSDGLGAFGLKAIEEVQITTSAVGLWTITINGTACSYTFSAAGTGNDKRAIAYGLIAAINAAPVAVSAKLRNDDKIVLEHDTVNTVMTVALTASPGAWTQNVVQLPGATGDLDSNKVKDIAEAFRDKFAALGAPWTSNIHCGIIGESTLFFYANQTITSFDVTDTRSDTLMRGVYHEVRAFDELPLRVHPNARFKVTLADVRDADDDIGYFVRYDTSSADESFGVEGEYIESTDYATLYELDATTFPHHIVPRFYDKDGNLHNGDAATGEPGALYFEFGPIDWEDRLVGDDDLSPWPSGLNENLNPSLVYTDLFFAKNRLGFVAGSAVDFSETSRFFSFFRTTNRTLLDSDPFTVVASHPDLSVIATAVPFSERLILFSDRAQMLLSGEPLSPRTVSIEPFVNFQVDTSVVPIVSGRSMFFPFPKVGHTGLREIYPSDSEILDADRTLQVPEYIPTGVKQFSMDRRGEFFVIRTEDRLFLYAYLREGQEVLQSAWSELIFHDEDTLEYAEFVGNDLVLIFTRADGTHIELMDLQVDATIPGAAWDVLMDRRTELITGSTYNGGANHTSFHLPYDAPADNTMIAVTAAGVVLPVTVAVGSQCFVTGNQVGVQCYIGVPYRADYEFTTPQAREFTGRAVQPISSAGVHLLYCRVAVSSAMHLTAVVTTTDSTDSEEVWESDTPDDAEFDISVLAPAEETTVILRSDSPLPVTIMNTEWEANLTNRGSRART